MAFYVPLVPVFGSRTELISHFSPRVDPHKTPMPIPVEISNVLSSDEWNDRTQRIFTHFSKYFWTKILRAYLLVVIFFTLVGPVIVNLVVNRTLFADVVPLKIDATNEQFLERLALVRKGQFINFTVSILLILLIWLPYYFYKAIARKRLRLMLEEFSAIDAKKGDMSALLWTCARTSTLQANGSISIHLPLALLSARQPSLFSNGAYLPPYLQQKGSIPHPPPPHPPPPQQQQQQPNNNYPNMYPTTANPAPAPAYEYPPPNQKN